MLMTTTLPDTAQDPRWPRIVARDAAADGQFWYSVVTTGVYCRPSCASRGANPANVTIHDTLDQARATGFRPCRRCDPEGEADAARHAAIVAAARTIERAETPPPLASLAAQAGMSPGHFQRVFKAATGLSPRGYAAALRAQRVRDALGAGESVTQALHDAGFGSAARFYAGAGAMLGMAPARYAAGAAGETLAVAVAVAPSGLGMVLVAASARGLAAILLGDDAIALHAELAARFPAARTISGDADFAVLVARAIRVVEGEPPAADLPMDIRGTAFQQRVWDELRRLKRGETVSYSGLAERIGAAGAARAVAQACAANAHAVAIPCHRVVRGDGALSGYRWGVERKRALLAREAG
jgi:AraC family transcriptional regulator, regulatory protein of adaptative response / methylated-DNA-[protein]-cysteine methyltransferase